MRLQFPTKRKSQARFLKFRPMRTSGQLESTRRSKYCFFSWAVKWGSTFGQRETTEAV